MNFLIVTAISLGVLLAGYGATFLVGRRLGRYNVVDVTWGLGFVVVAAVAAALGHGDRTRRIVLLVLVAIWGLRLAWHMVGKSRGNGEDPRYRTLLGDSPSTGLVLRKIFLTQAVAAWFVSLPVQLSATLGTAPTPALVASYLGIALWAIGLTFEAVGDRQLRAFKADPANKGAVMDRGLWAWTRHPNYFGDATVWWGIWLAAVAGPVSLATVLSPVLMTWFLVYATGARPTEKAMSGRPGFAEYCSRTSFFLPLPPQKHTS